MGEKNEGKKKGDLTGKWQLKTDSKASSFMYQWISGDILNKLIANSLSDI